MNSASKDQIITSENNLLHAMKTNNVELLDELLHDGLLFNSPDGTTATKAVDMKNYRSGNISLHMVVPSDQTISLIGDTAVVAVTVEIQGSYLGQALDGKFRYIRVWKAVESKWKVIAGSVIPLHTEM